MLPQHASSVTFQFQLVLQCNLLLLRFLFTGVQLVPEPLWLGYSSLSVFSSVLLSLVFLPDLFDTFIDLMRCFVPMDQKSVISQPTSDSTNSANIHSDSPSLNSQHEKDGCGCSIGGGVSTSPYPRKVPTNSMAILIRRTSNDGSVTPHE